MFEEQTYDAILNRMLGRGADDIDKREGAIFYDSLAMAAIEIAQAYWELGNVENEGFADTASREFLERRAAERYIEPYPATKAIVQASFEPNTVEIATGTRFNLGEYNYIVKEKIGDGIYRMQCETAGTAPNIITGELTPVEYIEGLTYGEITEVLILGEDEESTENFRKRYFETFEDKPSNGNIAWYKETVGNLQGVGGVKVIRAWNGAGTVKCIIQNSDYGVPTSALIDEVQTAIDPTVNQGAGVGLAAIGHTVTIDGVTADTINLTLNVTLSEDIEWADVSSSANNAIDDYLHELNETWGDEDNLVVRISQIETRLLNVSGVIDIENTKINGTAANYTVDSTKIAVRGTVTNG